MKKIYLILISLFILFIPNIVLATSDFTINSITKDSTIGEAIEESEPSINDNIINYNVRFFKVGDNIKYKINISNNTKDKLIIKDNISVLSNENIKYEIEIPDKSTTISNGSSKDIIISISYIKKANDEQFQNGIFKRNDNIEFIFRNKQLIVGVPNTFATDALKIVGIGLIILCVFGIIFTNTKQSNKLTSIILILICIYMMPKYVEASKEIKFNMEGNIITELNPCFFDADLTDGTMYQDDTYTYKYNQYYSYTSQYVSGQQVVTTEWVTGNRDGWGVKLTDENTTGVVSSTMCSSINTKPITALSNTYMNSKITNVDLKNANLEKVYTMAGMLRNISTITDVDLDYSGGDSLEIIKEMFKGSNNIKTISMKYFNFGKIEVIDYQSTIFTYDIPNVEEVDISYSYMPNVISLSELFCYNTKIKRIIMNHVYMPNNLTVQKIAYNCTSLKYFDMSDSITDKLEHMNYMFKFDGELEEVKLSGLNLNNLKTIHYTFTYNDKLKRVDLSEYKTPNLTSMNYMFNDCKNLEYINISNWGSDYISGSTYMVYNCPKLKTLIINNFNFGKASMSSTIDVYNSPLLEEIDFSGSDFSEVNGFGGWLYSYNPIALKKLIMTNCKFGENISSFMNHNSVEEIDFSGSDFSKVKNAENLFSNATKLKTINLDNSTIDNIEKVNNAFKNATSLEKLDFSHWDLSHVTSASDMLNNLTNLKELTTPKVNSALEIDLPFRMYAKNDTVGITKLTSETPTETILKSEPWS